MAASETLAFAPIAGRARIDGLDVLRGLAILGIFYMNSPFMGQQVVTFLVDPRLIGWSVADRNVWAFIQIYLEGTQRCLLEFLFGAGMMIFAAKAMEPDGPVAVADLYLRRNLWLLVFGLADIFLLLWVGDILHTYAIAALFLFPFRRLKPKRLLAIGLIYATVMFGFGASEYISRSTLWQTVQVAQARLAAHQAISPSAKKALKDWKEEEESLRITGDVKERVKEERESHEGGFLAYARFNWKIWMDYWIGKKFFFWNIIEAFSAMLIGVALFKWGIIQGLRSSRFYLILMAWAYGLGLTCRAIGVAEIFSFAPIPKTIWMTAEYARLATGIGHIALVNFALKTRAGAAILAPFKAAGRTAFSLYVMQTIIGMWILFSPFGFDLWARFGWAALALIATIVIAIQVVIANLWLRRFAMGPLEWLWRSLAYWEAQPFRRTISAGGPEAIPAGAVRM